MVQGIWIRVPGQFMYVLEFSSLDKNGVQEVTAECFEIFSDQIRKKKYYFNSEIHFKLGTI